MALRPLVRNVLRRGHRGHLPERPVVSRFLLIMAIVGFVIGAAASFMDKEVGPFAPTMEQSGE
jgi:hypothetical protein